MLRGRKTHVLAGSQASLLVAPFRLPDGAVSLFAVEAPTAGIAVEAEVGVDPTRRCARITFDGARVGPDARLARDGGDGGDGATALRDTQIRGFAALAAEMIGAAEATLAMTRDYAATRRQFDRPIGAFQAVKHPLVDMMIGVEMARTHACAAAAALDHDPERAETPARMAKALASDVLASATGRAVQLHGGYGFTWDADVHLYVKRALGARALLGDGVHHRRHLARALFGGAQP